jgi:hypothetical protein
MEIIGNAALATAAIGLLHQAELKQESGARVRGPQAGKQSKGKKKGDAANTVRHAYCSPLADRLNCNKSHRPDLFCVHLA